MRNIKLFLLNTFIAFSTFAIMKLIEGYYGACLLNYEFHNPQRYCGLTSLNILEIIAVFLLGTTIINWISIKKSKNIVQYLIISSPQIILLTVLLLGFMNFHK